MKTDPAVPIMIDVGTEIRRSNLKHGGPLTPKLSRAMAILQEEVGELQREINDITRIHEGEARQGNLTRVRRELVQVVAVGTQMLENIQEGRVEYE